MPVISGNIRDITGSPMSSQEIVLIFTLNAPNVTSQAAFEGRVYPTEPIVVKPDATGEFSVTLASTTPMLTDAWYILQLVWLSPNATDPTKGASLRDFPDWRIVVGGDDGTLLDMIQIGPSSGGGPGRPNQLLWWVGLTPPPSRGYIWNYLDPENPDLETGPNPNLALGDILIRWW